MSEDIISCSHEYQQEQEESPTDYAHNEHGERKAASFSRKSLCQLHLAGIAFGAGQNAEHNAQNTKRHSHGQTNKIDRDDAQTKAHNGACQITLRPIFGLDFGLRRWWHSRTDSCTEMLHHVGHLGGKCPIRHAFTIHIGVCGHTISCEFRSLNGALLPPLGIDIIVAHSEEEFKECKILWAKLVRMSDMKKRHGRLFFLF